MFCWKRRPLSKACTDPQTPESAIREQAPPAGCARWLSSCRHTVLGTHGLKFMELELVRTHFAGEETETRRSSVTCSQSQNWNTNPKAAGFTPASFARKRSLWSTQGGLVFCKSSEFGVKTLDLGPSSLPLISGCSGIMASC